MKEKREKINEGKSAKIKENEGKKAKNVKKGKKIEQIKEQIIEK